MEIKNYFAQDDQGNILPGAKCFVYFAGSSNLADGLVDKNGAPLPNPFDADSDGLVQFAAPDGTYDLRITLGDRSQRIRVQCLYVEDVAQLSELASPTDPELGAALIGRGVVALGSIVDLLAVPAGVRRSDLRFEVRGYHADTDIGGGAFYWDAGRPKSEHNGGTVISPTVPWDGGQEGLSGFLNGAGESDPGGDGCWVRGITGSISPSYFGALGDGVSDDTEPFQIMLKEAEESAYPGANDIYVPAGVYSVKSFSFESTETTIKFVGQGVGTVFKLSGTDSDAKSYTRGTTTVTANLLFRGGGYANTKNAVGNFLVIGNGNISYGVAFCQFFRASKIDRISFQDFSKDGAVPLTLMNCLTSDVRYIEAIDCQRFIRIVGMADAVFLKQPVTLFFNKDYSQIFNEPGYLSEDEPVRYPINLIMESPYCYALGSDATTTGEFIELNNCNKTVVRNVWPEGVRNSVTISGGERNKVSSLSSVSSIGRSIIRVINSYNNHIDTEGPVELSGSSCIENNVTTQGDLPVVSFVGGASPVNNIITAKNSLYYGRPTFFEPGRFGFSGIESEPIGPRTPESRVMQVYESGTYEPVVYANFVPSESAVFEGEGYYTRVGRLVHFSITVLFSTAPSESGELRVSLPYAPSKDARFTVTDCCYNFTGTRPSVVRLFQGQRQAQFLGSNGNTVVVTSDVADNGRLFISGMYVV